MDKKSNLEKAEGINLSAQDKAKQALKGFASKATVLPVATKKGTVMVKSLNIRKDHSAKSEGVGGLVAGNEVTIYETFEEAGDTWGRIGDDQWVAMVYKGQTYVKVN
jgi:hypothetical protein